MVSHTPVITCCINLPNDIGGNIPYIIGSFSKTSIYRQEQILAQHTFNNIF